MTTEELTTQPQTETAVEEPKTAAEAGMEPMEPSQPGAETTAPTTDTDLSGKDSGGTEPETKSEDEPRTYTQEEVAAIKKSGDERDAASKETIAKQAREFQIRELQRIEAGHQTKDQADVDAGDITETEATQRREARITSIKTEIANAEAEQARNTAMAEANYYARARTAEELATKYGIDGPTLFNEESLTSTAMMEIKARELSLDKREAAAEAGKKGDESFDSNLAGGGGSSIETMSADDKIRAGLKGLV